MNIRVLRRIVEIFFQRWPLYVLLLAGFVGLGVFSVSRSANLYTSSGTIFVDNQSLVSTQSGVGSGNVFSYLSPAQFTSQELYGLLQTDVFMGSVLERAEVDLPEDPALRADEVASIRNGVLAYDASQNLVKVNVSSPDPDLSWRLTDAIIAEFVQFKIGLDVAESGASEAFFNELAAAYEADLESAREDIDDALRGVENVSELPPDRQLEIERLREAEALADERFQAAVQDIEISRLAGLQTETDVRQSYSTFDPPQRPSEPDANFFDGIVLLLMATVAGVIAALAWPTLSGLTTRSILFPEEIDDTPILGTVPRISRRLVQLKHAPAASPGDRVPMMAGGGGIADQASRTITFKSTAETSETSGPSETAAAADHRVPAADPAPVTAPDVDITPVTAPDPVIAQASPATDPERPATETAPAAPAPTAPAPPPERRPIRSAPIVVPPPGPTPAPTPEPVAPEPVTAAFAPEPFATAAEPEPRPGSEPVIDPGTAAIGSDANDDVPDDVPPISSWDPVTTIQFNLPPAPPPANGDADDGASLTTRSKHG